MRICVKKSNNANKVSLSAKSLIKVPNRFRGIISNERFADNYANTIVKDKPFSR